MPWYYIKTITPGENPEPVEDAHVKIDLPGIGTWEGDTNEDGIFSHQDDANVAWNAAVIGNFTLNPLDQDNPAAVAGPDTHVFTGNNP